MKNAIIFSAVVVMLFIFITFAMPAVLGPSFCITKIFKSFSLERIISENVSLRKKIADLEAELYAMRNIYVLPNEIDLKTFKVYSVYPFNSKSKIYIAGGYLDGISVNMPVLFSKNVLIGKIVRVSKRKSEAITIFDPSFSMPVRIGEEEVQGLLKGGVDPKIELIEQSGNARTGDLIVSASKDFPYGLLVGSIASIEKDSSGAFLSARVSIPYSIADLVDVNLFFNF